MKSAERSSRQLLPEAEIFRLDNGFEVGVIANPQAPVVATALWYRAGTRDEAAEHAGTAHFLEHMMFKGARRYGSGEIDRLTRALGGSNNAFTSHDASVYHFTFAADRWQTALDIEVDRMTDLALESREVDSERQVIAEEIAMYEGEPWDALEMEVIARFHGRHSYARPVLGNRESLARIDAEVLRTFHRRFYRPGNAVLAVVGDVDPEDVRRGVEERFAALDGAGRQPPPAEESDRPTTLERIERRHGEVSRLLLALPAPPADDPEHAYLRLLLAVLASGRSSRLHRRLVDEGQLCVWTSADLGETQAPGCMVIAAEVVPGVEPEQVESALLEEVEDLARRPPSVAELSRAVRVYYADWVFGHEKVEQQALLLGSALTLFDRDHPWRHLETLRNAAPDTVREVAERAFGRGLEGVLGWSLPQDSDAH